MKPADQPISVHVAGRVVQVWPKPSERARRVRLSVKPGPRVELTYPANTSLASALAFLKDNLPWLEQVFPKARAVQPSLLAHLEKSSHLEWHHALRQHLRLNDAIGLSIAQLLRRHRRIDPLRTQYRHTNTVIAMGNC